jgi:hypothetical protein
MWAQYWYYTGDVTLAQTYVKIATYIRNIEILWYLNVNRSRILIHSFISDNYIAPIRNFYSEAFPTTARTLNRSFKPKSLSNCEWRTCPESLRGGLRWIRTRNPAAARHRTYPTPPRPFSLWHDQICIKRWSSIGPTPAYVTLDIRGITCQHCVNVDPMLKNH